jgi:hypothetical protein
MAVKAENLANPEQGLAVETREGTGKRPIAQAPLEPEAQLLAIRQKIRRGLNEVGDDPRPKDAAACRECFQRGWLAAMKSLQE